MPGTEGNGEVAALETLVGSLAQSVLTLTARQIAPTDQLKNPKSLPGLWNINSVA